MSLSEIKTDLDHSPSFENEGNEVLECARPIRLIHLHHKFVILDRKRDFAILLDFTGN